jgi:hypothetical protein
MQPEEKQRMYDYINGEIGEDEREFMINYIHDYFMNEMERFNDAGEKYGLTFDFTRPPFGESLLLKIYRLIFSHTTGENKIASGPRSKNFLFPNYKTFVNAFESGKIEVETNDISRAIPVLDDEKNKKAENGADRTYKNYFTINMPNLIRNAEKTDTIKNYAIVPRLSIYNQFKFNDNVDLSKYSSKGRYLIIDDNYASGASIRNAAKLLHDGLGVPYKNIKALTPGDMGGAATGGAQGEKIATYAAEGELVNSFRNGRLKDVLGNNSVDNGVFNRLKTISSKVKMDKDFDTPIYKNGKKQYKISHPISDELANSHFDKNGKSILGKSSLPNFTYSTNSVDIPDYDFKIRDYKKYLQDQNPVSSSNDESEPLKMAADNVQRTPTPVVKKEKIDISEPVSQNPQAPEPINQKPSDSTTALPIRHYSEDELKKIHRAKKVSPEEIDNVITSLDNDIKNIEMTASSFIKGATTEQQKVFFKNYWDRVKWKKKFEKLKERKCN